MGWLRLVESIKSYVSFAKATYKRDYILQKRPIILRSLLTVATPYACIYSKSSRQIPLLENSTRTTVTNVTLLNHTRGGGKRVLLRLYS